MLSGDIMENFTQATRENQQIIRCWSWQQFLAVGSCQLASQANT